MQANRTSPTLCTDNALLRLAFAAQKQGYTFVTPTPCTHERVNQRSVNRLAVSLRDILGWNRPFEPHVISDELFKLMQQADMLMPLEGCWKSRLRLSTLDGHLYWHSAHPTIESDAVFFGPDTYRFVRAIKHHLHERGPAINRAFDMGCGAGPGAISIALAQPKAQVWAGDINPAALRLTAINASIAGAANLQARHSDLLNGVEGGFDLIVANPPYLNDPLERAYRHGGGSHGQSLALAMLEAALPRLASEGSLLLYTGATIVQGRDTFLAGAQRVLRQASGVSWHYQEVDPDVFGEELDNPAYQDAERIAAVVLTVDARPV